MKDWDYYAEPKDVAYEEFWKDAREELGYDKFLNADGVSCLESKAYEEGHSAGFSEVFLCLGDLTEFARQIIASVQQKK